MIGGNTKAILQVSTTTKNEIGERISTWNDAVEFWGWLDLRSGDSNYTTYNAKIQESSHIFICDYKPIPDSIVIDGKTVSINVENARMVINGLVYDVKLIDNPMELNQHYEFYLDYTGGQ